MCHKRDMSYYNVFYCGIMLQFCDHYLSNFPCLVPTKPMQIYFNPNASQMLV